MCSELNFEDLSAAAVSVLTAPDPTYKVARTAEVCLAFRAGRLTIGYKFLPPPRPARPAEPPLVAPNKMKKRGLGTQHGRRALLHALAHIELNAIDLAWDMVARFGNQVNDPRFVGDWLKVAWDEAFHFAILEHRLRQLGGHYGEFPAHDGLWEAAVATAHDLEARLAVVPLVLEARGLDVTPLMIDKLREQKDPVSAQVLQRIYDDEIHHVAIGKYWFGRLVPGDETAQKDHYQQLVRRYFRGLLKSPFNQPARDQAQFFYDWYAPLAERFELPQ